MSKVTGDKKGVSFCTVSGICDKAVSDCGHRRGIFSKKRKKKENDSGDRVLSTEESFLEAFKDFIRENDHMCSSF